MIWLSLALAGSILSDEQKDDESVAEMGVNLAPVLPPLGPVTLANPPVKPTTTAAAAMLRVPEDLVIQSQRACDLLYARRYKDAKLLFDSISTRYPTSGVGPLGWAILYQALMFENFDWRYDQAFRNSAAQTRAQLDQGFAQTGGEPLEFFVLAGVGGLEAVHSLRKGDYLQALGSAVTAMRALNETKAAAPEFADPKLGDGMYLYWRSIVTASSSLLPNFPDKRAEGILAMMATESAGILLGPGASLVKAYAWIEERNLPLALEAVDVNAVRYPDCIVNNLTRGRILTSLRRYDAALAQYDAVIAQNVGNERVYYFRGVVLGRLGRDADAIAAWTTYLGFANPPAEYRGQTYFRVAVAQDRVGHTTAATDALRSAAALGNVAAKRALEKR